MSASALKDEGNAYFKKKDFEKAYKCYTLALSDSPLNAVLYSNRAAAALAMKQYREAELDCGIAISLDKTFAKAFFRRAQARLAQGKVDQAAFDAQDAHKLAPGKATAQLCKEIEEKQKKNDEDDDNDADDDVLVNHDDSSVDNIVATDAVVAVVEEKIQEEKIEVVKSAPPLVEPVIVNVKYSGPLKAPKTAFELEKNVRNIRHDAKLLKEYFTLLDPKSFPKLLGNSLNEDLLRLLCLAFMQEGFSASLAIALLSSLLQTLRFEMVIDFLEDDTKADFARLIAQWKENGVNVPDELERFCK